MKNNYTDEKVITLEWNEHIRRRPGMYIGKLGNGSSYDDGIYVLLKEVIDNSIDEYMMGFGKRINITLDDNKLIVRDFGRGVPLTKVKDVASKMNTGAKYDSNVFKKAIGLNGVGIKAVNALSNEFIIKSYRENKVKEVKFSKGNLIKEYNNKKTTEKNGTEIIFIPDNELFENFIFNPDIIINMIKNYVYLNTGLKIYFNKEVYTSKNGILDLLNSKISDNIKIYEPIHLKDKDIEIAFLHTTNYNEDYYTYVNGQHTTQHGTHLLAFKNAFVKSIRELYKKNYNFSDIRNGLTAVISIKIEEPVFESQTKTKLGSKNISPNKDALSVGQFIQNFLDNNLITYFHKNKNIFDNLLKKIKSSEKERKEIQEIKNLSKKRNRNVKIHNKKLRDCRIHYNTKDKNKDKSIIFITEGDSASGSITKSRNVNYQAVFSLKGKPLNVFTKTKKIIYENEEFNLLQLALNINDENINNLKYNKIIIATDADVDGMHIRLLLMTFFLKFYPNIIKNGHLYILQTPLFRVRNKRTTKYCYSEEEKEKIVANLKTPEITRFKGLGEISPDEFKFFIGDDIRLEKVNIAEKDNINDILSFYMGKNTNERQEFILNNLKIED